MLLLLACVTADPKDTSGGVDSVADSATDTLVDTLPDELNGVAPAEPVDLPSFTARNQLGEGRTETDLVGHPSVLWFYPAATTAG